MIETETGPFAIVPLWILDALVADGNAEALKLYVALYRWADRQGGCYPSRQTIASVIGVSLDSVDRYTKALVRVGAMEVNARISDEGDRTSNLYRLAQMRPGSRTDAATGTSTDAATGGRVDAAGTRPSIEPDPIEPKTPPTPPRGRDVDEAFEQWWAHYPKKKNGKGQAREKWRKMTWGDRDAALAHIETHVGWWAAHRTDDRFIPAGVVWLNQRRWEDEEPRSAPTGKPSLVERAKARAHQNQTVFDVEAR